MAGKKGEVEAGVLSLLLCNVDHSGAFHEDALKLANEPGCSFFFTPEPYRKYVRTKCLFGDEQ